MKRPAAMIASQLLALLVLACGGASPAPSGVATLPNPSGGPVASASSSPTPAPSGQVAQALAYAQCMRANGVNWPDPGGDGQFDKSQLRRLVPSLTPQVAAAETACQDLLPTGNQASPETQAELRQAWNDAAAFAQCMRSHGFTDFPDPAADPQHPSKPYFDLHGTTIDPNSPQVLAAVQSCQSLLHLTFLPPTSGGSRS